MRVSYSISFYCRPSKSDRNGDAPLEASISINGQRLFLNLPIKFKPGDFNKKRRDPKINTIVDHFRNKAQDCIGELLEEGLPITAATLRNKLKTGGTVSKTISSLFDEYLAFIKPRVGHSMVPSVYRKYETTRDSLLEHFGDREIVSLRPTDLEGYYNVLRTKYKPSTSGGMITKVKTVMTYATTNGYVRTNPCGLLKIEKGEPVYEYLDEDELERLKTTPLPDVLEKVRVISLVQLYTGLAYCDAQRFNINDCKEVDGILLYSGVRQKTKVKFTSIVFPELKTILEPYNGKTPQLPNQCANRYLKQIAFLCNINKNLHTHLFRKTYATNLLSKGIPMSTIALTLGHTTSQITQKVYAFTTDNLVAEQAKVLFK